MKKRNLLSAILCTAALTITGIMPNTVMADATKVVTLGADLSDAQKSTMMKYFKVNKDEVQILYITNADEKEHLSAYIPSEQIGNRTVSCAYVRPTTSGGIKVRTANLNYVTSNMIASTLSTSGVKNCQVVAACPFEVSGTGALTGIMMAYEKATGEVLDSKKKDIATHEMVVTGNLAQNIDSNKEAVNIINSGKMEVVGNEIQNADEIKNIVVNIAQENNVNISQDQLDEIVSLLQEIADQGYEYEDMKETLESVEENVNDNMIPTDEPTDEDEEYQEVDEDSILDDLDTAALGSDVFESSTEDPDLEVETGMSQDAEITDADEWNLEGDSEDWEIVDEGIQETDGDDSFDAVWNEEISDGDTDAEWNEMISEEDEMNLELLNEEQKEKFEHFVNFCKGEFEGDVKALQEEMDDQTYPNVTLDTEVAEKLIKTVQKFYYDLLKDGTEDYIPSEMDDYFAPELNILAKELKEMFNLEGYAEPGSYLDVVSELDRQTLYDDTMKFFEKLYDENLTEVADEGWSTEVDEASYDEGYEASYDETDNESYDEIPDDDDSYEEVEW